MRGLSQLDFLRGLSTRVTADPEGVRRDLETLRECILTRHGLVAGLTASPHDLEQAVAAVEAFGARLPDATPAKAVWTPML